MQSELGRIIRTVFVSLATFVLLTLALNRNAGPIELAIILVIAVLVGRFTWRRTSPSSR